MSTDKEQVAKVVSWLTDSQGNKSSMRVAFAVALGISFLILLLQAIGVADPDPQVSETIKYVVMAAFGGKAIQKFGN
ncbi:MAG: hypothetical protein OXE58_12970 [Acidobacteria bacterium]|nr:hypothetical protein [Acidobacteriota bacterium]